MAELSSNAGLADDLKQKFCEISQRQSKRFFVEDHHLMSRILDPCISTICHDVKYVDIKMALIPIFTMQQIEEAECGKGSTLQMVQICETVKRLSLKGFINFVIVLSKDHKHVADTIIKRIQTFDVEKEFPQVCVPSQMPFFSNTVIAQECSPPKPSKKTTSSSMQKSAGCLSPSTDVLNPNLTSKPNSTFSCRSLLEALNNINSQTSQSLELLQQPSGIQEAPLPLFSPTNGSVSSASTCSETPISAAARMFSFGSVDNSERISCHRPSGYSHHHNHTVLGAPSSLCQAYDMTTAPRGMALIMNNINFTHFKDRQGSMADATNLYNMFKYLGFHVCTISNKKAVEMLELLKSFSKHQNLRSVSSLAVAILSHGGSNDSVFGTDGQMNGECPVQGTYITKMDIIQIFKGSVCTAMEGKPKLFILQACRGSVENVAESTYVSSDNSHSSGEANSKVFQGYKNSTTHRSTDTEPSSGDSNQGQTSKIYGDDPLEAGDHKEPEPHRTIRKSGDRRVTGPSRPADTADMCFVHSSSYGHKAYRMRSQGSPFIQEFTKTVMEKAAQTEFRDIVQEIQRHFNLRRLPNNMKTLPDFSLQLMKKWYLNPPVK